MIDNNQKIDKIPSMTESLNDNYGPGTQYVNRDFYFGNEDVTAAINDPKATEEFCLSHGMCDKRITLKCCSRFYPTQVVDILRKGICDEAIVQGQPGTMTWNDFIPNFHS